ncbi:MAG: 16S rRNA (cytidine(1402)-2'-O)-methyltransferase [Thermoleophilia bacterium]
MLYVCPTPIGNLGDVTLRVLDALRQADLVAAEDTRRTRKLLSHYDISKPLISFFEHNEVRRLPDLLKKMKEGKTIALVSDAGMPGICDPGYRLVKAALDDGLQVVVLPGPSAVETALVSSGFASDSFVFLGYLPRKKGELDKVLESIAGESRSCVAFETPHRLAATLSAAVPHMGERRIAVCRELTKKFEEILRGTAAQLSLRLPGKVKGEIVLVFEPREQEIPKETGLPDNVEDAIRGLLEEGVSARKLSQLVALATGVSKNRAYKLTLQIKQDSSGVS